MKKYNLNLNEVQAKMLQRMLKEEIMQQRQWKKEGNNKEIRDYLSANMWDLIEQLCAQGEDEYWLAGCMNRTDEEEDEMENVK